MWNVIEEKIVRLIVWFHIIYSINEIILNLWSSEILLPVMTEIRDNTVWSRVIIEVSSCCSFISYWWLQLKTAVCSRIIYGDLPQIKSSQYSIRTKTKLHKSHVLFILLTGAEQLKRKWRNYPHFTQPVSKDSEHLLAKSKTFLPNVKKKKSMS